MYKRLQKYSLISSIVTILIIVAMFLVAKPPSEVHGLTVDTTYNTASLSWDKSDAKEYYVYRSEGDKYVFVGATEENSFTDKDLKTGETYTYFVKAVNGIKRSKFKSIEAKPLLDAPEISVSVKEGSVEINISEVEGAEGYNVFRGDEKVATTESPIIEDENAPIDEELTYTANAFVDKSVSPKSNEETVSLASIGEVKAYLSGDDAVLSWEGNEMYTGYEVYKDGELALTTEENGCRISLDGDKLNVRIVGTGEGLRSPACEKAYEVVEEQMTNEQARQAAVDWGIKIAADNSYTYGQGTFYCNVCGKTPKKQWTCMPFVGACYAHGAKDPVMLAGGRHVVHTHDGNFSGELGKLWTKVGLCKDLTVDDLEVGDVLIWWSSSNGGSDNDPGHACIYAGDDRILESTSAGSSADQIHLTGSGVASKRLRSYGSDNSRDPETGEKKKYLNYVMRYVGNGGISKVLKEIEAPEEEAPHNATE